MSSRASYGRHRSRSIRWLDSKCQSGCVEQWMATGCQSNEGGQMKSANQPPAVVHCTVNAQNRVVSAGFERPTEAICLPGAAAPHWVAALPHCGAFESDLDWIAVEWTARGIRRLTFGHPTADTALARWQDRTGTRAAPSPVPLSTAATAGPVRSRRSARPARRARGSERTDRVSAAACCRRAAALPTERH